MRAGAARQEIARKHKVSEVTVARAVSARNFAARLVRQGRLQQEESLQIAPITFISALSRIDRYRPDLVDGLLPSVLAGTLVGDYLRKCEAAAQAEYERSLPHGTAGSRGAVPRDGYALRSRAKNFRDRALRALSNAKKLLPADQLVRVPAKMLPFPLVVDGIATIPDLKEVSFRGIRAYPTAALDSDRKRLSWALLAGSLASRVFHEYLAVFEQEDDAWELSGMIAEFGGMGFGAAFVDAAERLHITRDASRGASPDLSDRFSDLFERLFEFAADTRKSR